MEQRTVGTGRYHERDRIRTYTHTAREGGGSGGVTRTKSARKGRRLRYGIGTPKALTSKTSPDRLRSHRAMAERAAVSLDNRTSTKKTSESATATAIGQPVASVSAAAAIDVAHSFETAFRRDLAIPLHVQHVQRALNLKPIVDFVETMFGENVRPSMNGELRRLNGLLKSRNDREYIERDKTTIKAVPFDLDRIEAKERAWIQNVIDESSDEDEDEDEEICEEDVQRMLRIRVAERATTNVHVPHSALSIGLLTTSLRFDDDHRLPSRFIETKTTISTPRRRRSPNDEKKKKKKSPLAVTAAKKACLHAPKTSRSMIGGGGSGGATQKKKKKKTDAFDETDITVPMEAFSERDENRVRKRLFTFIGKKEVPKVSRLRNLLRNNQLTHLRKIAVACHKEQRKRAAKSQKRTKDGTTRAKRIMKEVLLYWKKFEKVERDQRRKAEKEALEQKKLVEEMKEARRQQRKLNFLITQTELYAHFMAKKLIGEKESSSDKILKKLEEGAMQRRLGSGALVTLEPDEEFDINDVKMKAMSNVQEAVENHEAKTREYNVTTRQHKGGGGGMQEKFDESYSLANPLMNVGDAPQPSTFDGQLKTYQLRGMNWLASLYHQGINGILADEMGLGKTVQSIALLAHLAETQNIWGPFLVVAPASTLHNWQQEVTRFVPAFKVLPYWGTAAERKILRKFWSQDKLTVYSKDAPFHILITSYQLVIADVKYFHRIQWQYMILDEAQAIKSTSSVRWKMLLDFKCRNRLLLTGTPIQNTMAELWALLHFIMPTLFDSHAEFNEWFSKDIESHAEKKSGLDENQLSRLHLILKPFMLRRVKKDVENEMADKIEIQLMCRMTERQRLLYRGLRNKITIEELLASTSTASTAQATSNTLMNLVMQFRKVCNHPELFERRDVQSPLFFHLPPYHLPALLHRQELVGGCPRESKKLFYSSLSIWSPDHIHESQFSSSDGLPAGFSFLRFIDMSPSETSASMLGGLLFKLMYCLVFVKMSMLLEHRALWWENDSQSSRKFLIASSSAPSRKLVFTNYVSPVTSHRTHKIFRSIRHNPVATATATTSRENDPLLLSDTMTPLEIRYFQPTMLPSFLICYLPKTVSLFVSQYCVSRASQSEREELERGGNWAEHQLIMRGLAPLHLVHANHSRYFSNSEVIAITNAEEEGGFWGCMPRGGWFRINIPNKDSLIIDSGKLSVLDRLLSKLKREGHRVLIYSQMTKMIDLLEEYMYYRKHKYIRLDGSSKIADRRDMVADFQSRSDLFVFLLSTRAGGLGINLTAADTVVFYDSDWNPTVDQQAMDRAHRLGQTKQVTVYRLVTKGTVEERILQRAKEKSEIQKMVISGGHFKPDALKPKEVVSLLLDDAEMESKFLQKQAEQEQAKRRRNKRKKPLEQSAESGASETKKKGLPSAPFLDHLLGSPSLSASRPPSVMSSALSNDFDLDLSIDLGEDESSNNAPSYGEDPSVAFGDAVTAFTSTPPPATAKGRGKGRGKSSETSRKKKTSQKPKLIGDEVQAPPAKKRAGKKKSAGDDWTSERFGNPLYNANPNPPRPSWDNNPNPPPPSLYSRRN
ncbi:chromatin-remodeling ATPase INO80-like [Oscarella lobularis]|uniref:chromatin-remodeling ATPase INO80-like n=1 Tax=Oscarella lobularis TaxID=121494 RepID=UPI0033144F0A